MITRPSLLGTLSAPLWSAPARRTAMRHLPPDAKVTLRAEEDWYMHSVGVAALPKETVITYRRSDEHVASMAEVWCCRSSDGGRTWGDHKMITRLGWAPDKASWVAPQLGKTKDGTLLLLIDRGEKTSEFDWPMLSQWQQKPRGMSNWLMTSSNGGRTWTGPRKVDNVGGEPSYIIELSNGSWVYTRTDSKPTTAKKVPSMPWGPNYYRSTAVFSDDKGKTWTRTVPVADDPLVGDCEVGLAEYAPGKIVAVSRIGDAGRALGQPSRFIHSSDFGKTWSKPVLSPVYAHRAYVRQLQNGHLMMTFRNAWGTTGTSFFVWDPRETFTYQPNSWLWDDARTILKNDVLEVHTAEGTANCCEFTLYPMEDDDSAAELSFDLSVKSAQANTCNVCAGGWIRFLPQRIEIADRPESGFAIDATKWHSYRILNRGHRLQIFVDGEKKLDVPTEGIYTRHVRFGNRSGIRGQVAARRDGDRGRQPLRGIQYNENAGLSLWRSFHAKVSNRRDHSIDWKWTPRDGFPDQFRRDRIVRVERNGSFVAGDSGYSSWDQLADGSVIIGDYTGGVEGFRHPVLRAYRVGSEFLTVG